MSKKQEKGFFSRWFFKMQRKLSFEMQLSLNFKKHNYEQSMGNKINQIPNTFLSNSFPIREPKKAMVLCFFYFCGFVLKIKGR